ncbi:MAG: DUF3160 domain-containing protein [Chloroflexi bacterium]|nr:MAG: DUF3160 domain-containing protein [Chloroflexota bacterium]
MERLHATRRAPRVIERESFESGGEITRGTRGCQMAKAIVTSLWMLSVLILAGCARPSPEGTPPLPTEEGAIASPSPIPPAAEATPTPLPPITGLTTARGHFAEYRPVPVDVTPSVAPYSFDLGSIANPDLALQLDEAQAAALEAQGFVVVPSSWPQIYLPYKRAAEEGLPIFVTTDALLHTYHILYDYTLRLAEYRHFVADLEALTQAMLEEAQAQYQAAPEPVKEAARRNIAFFAVARRLLDPTAPIPAPVEEVVQQELALIEQHAGFAPSPIFGYPEDYSQYVPRGHYTRNETFERYFRAMMWYGRMGFHPTVRDEEQARRETRQALLIVLALHRRDQRETWERIYEPTVFFVGAADDLTVYDYTDLARQVYGGLPTPEDLADDERLDTFRRQTATLRPPQIVGGYVEDWEDVVAQTRSFRFMGQRFIPDSYIFQQLVYDQVGRYRGSGRPFTLVLSDAGPIRGFPRGLDIPAVLGSERALEILRAEGDADYEGYEEQVARLREAFAALPEEQWTGNLYWNWLYSLLPLLTPPGEGYPAFMQTPAWVDKDLHTWLGSWTELRHDTILYAKQSYTVRATGAMPEPERPPAYVEPRPQVYARLAALTRQTREGLESRGLLDKEPREKLERMEALLLSLKTMAEKELRGEALSAEEYATLRRIGSTLESLTTFSPVIQEQVESEADERMAIVADVHTDTNSGQVLEEGVGDAFTLYVLVPVEGQVWLMTGATFSYYEFKQPIADRLTDEAWQAMDPKPDRPAWTRSFIR